jgi:hypothetical protein
MQARQSTFRSSSGYFDLQSDKPTRDCKRFKNIRPQLESP